MTKVSQRADGAWMLIIPKAVKKLMQERHGWRAGREVVIVPTDDGKIEIIS